MIALLLNCRLDLLSFASWRILCGGLTKLLVRLSLQVSLLLLQEFEVFVRKLSLLIALVILFSLDHIKRVPCLLLMASEDSSTLNLVVHTHHFTTSSHEVLIVTSYRIVVLALYGSWNCLNCHVIRGSHAKDLGVTAHFAEILFL